MTTETELRPPVAAGSGARSHPTGLAALAGLVSAAVTLAVAEVISLLVGGVGNPILSVGSLIIDLVPPAFKTLVIDLFDTADKLVLFICLGLVVAVFAAIAGNLQYRKPPWGAAVLAMVASVALLGALTRADATPTNAIPTVVGAIFGIAVLRVLIRRLRAWLEAPPRRAFSSATGMERRSFLRLAIVAGVTSAVVGSIARAAAAGASAVQQVRTAIGLPTAASAAPAVADGQTLDVEGLSPWVTPNAEFYRIDTALQVPSVDPSEWQLRVTGMVEQEVSIGFDELLAEPLVERYVTLACVSNEVGGNLIGNALWLGYPIRSLLARARPLAGADMVLSRSVDGFTASTPLEVLRDEGTGALLAVGMNGEPLPLEHGFPVRMVVPGLYGYVSATKWVVELKVTTFAEDLAYWSTRGWTERGPVKISSRIDTSIAAEDGSVTVAGVAWAQHTGISKVEVRVDDGRWMDARLADTVTVDSWLQWSIPLTASSGSHEVTVRATDLDGRVQVSEYAPPAPDGSTGLHSMSVSFP